ncbi:MAG: ribonuclease P protein component [Spirochaetales bacterium]|nr:ribonuclease P protein component [Spirochaetales bacterium]
MRKSLSKSEIVRRRSEIDRIFKTGRKTSSRGMSLIVTTNDLPFSRIVVIPTRKYGSAVERNRIRRQIREIWRTEKDRFLPGYDFAFVVYPGRNVDHAFQRRHVLTLCRQAGVMDLHRSP